MTRDEALTRLPILYRDLMDRWPAVRITVSPDYSLLVDLGPPIPPQRLTTVTAPVCEPCCWLGVIPRAGHTRACPHHDPQTCPTCRSPLAAGVPHA